MMAVLHSHDGLLEYSVIFWSSIGFNKTHNGLNVSNWNQSDHTGNRLVPLHSQSQSKVFILPVEWLAPLGVPPKNSNTADWTRDACQFCFGYPVVCVLWHRATSSCSRITPSAVALRVGPVHRNGSDAPSTTPAFVVAQVTNTAHVAQPVLITSIETAVSETCHS